MRALALAIVLLLPSLASAQRPEPQGAEPPRPEPQAAEPQLGSIREMIFAARFGEAVDGARNFLNRLDISAGERNAGLEALATAQIAMRATDDARQTLGLLYARDPGHRLTDPDASPPVVSAFARAREAQPEPVPVHLDHTPPRLSRRESPEIRASVTEGADAVAEVRLVYRTGAEGTTRVVMTPRDDGSYSARIPVVGDASRATDVAYHIVALAPSLAVIAAMGSEAEPLQLRIPPEGERASTPQGELPPVLQTHDDDLPPDGGGGGGSVAEEWWFWAILVTLVAGGVTVGVVLGTQQSPTEGTLGSARLMQLEW